MGGRGASSGVNVKGKEYGTEFVTLHQSGNIKFVQTAEGASKTPMETMTKGRVYATVNSSGTLKSITYYDKHNKRFKQIDIAGVPHTIDGVPVLPHVHKGYLHNEKGDRHVSEKERKMIERITRIWYNKQKRG